MWHLRDLSPMSHFQVYRHQYIVQVSRLVERIL